MCLVEGSGPWNPSDSLEALVRISLRDPYWVRLDPSDPDARYKRIFKDSLQFVLTSRTWRPEKMCFRAYFGTKMVFFDHFGPEYCRFRKKWCMYTCTEIYESCQIEIEKY